MFTIKRDRKAYAFARDYLLLHYLAEGVTPQLLEKYLHFSESAPRPDSLEEIYSRILFSAQNAQMKSRVIAGSIGGINNLEGVLFGFKASEVVSKYQDDWERVLEEIIEVVKPRGEIRRTPKSCWPQYCQTILSAAIYLSQFSSADEFYNFIEFFDKNDMARPALPMMLSHEIKGVGFTLACDFLKELGYVNFAKPDVWIKKIFTELELCPSDNDYMIFKAVVRVAKNVGVTPYNVDKLFWLLGSGYFYDDPHIGNNGRLKTDIDDFINHAKIRLKK